MVIVRRSFTLVEILIVVAIIAVLAAIAIPSLLRARVDANEARAKATLRALVTATEGFAAQTGAYPASQSNLTNMTPPYISLPICNTSSYGYIYNCSGWGPGGYTITVAPQACGVSGSRNWTVTTGNVWNMTDCGS